MAPPSTQSPGLKSRVFSNSSLFPLSCRDLPIAKTGHSDIHTSHLLLRPDLTFTSRHPVWHQAPCRCPLLSTCSAASTHLPSRRSSLTGLFADKIPVALLPVGQNPHCVQTSSPHLPPTCLSSSTSCGFSTFWASQPVLLKGSRLAQPSGLCPWFPLCLGCLSLSSSSQTRFRYILWGAHLDS